MQWSYSRLTSFDHCKYEFYLNYIIADDDEYLSESNYYAEVGSYVHEILAMIFEGKLAVEDASEYYVNHFDEKVFYKTRESTMDKTFETCAEYFCNVDFDWLKDYEILGVEKKVNFEIHGYKFIGFIDLLLRDKRDGKIVVVDNKSSEYPFPKDGKVKASAKSNFEKYKYQMYLYCYGVNEEYGEMPKEISWNHFKSGGQIATIPFNEAEYQESIDYLLDIIKRIEDEESYPSIIEELDGTEDLHKEYFYCHNLCNFRHSCEYNLNTDWSSV